MKKIITYFVIFLFMLLPTTINCYAQDLQFDCNVYNECLESYDLSAFNYDLDNDTKNILSLLGIDDFDVFSIASLSFNEFISIIKNIFVGKLQSPVKCFIEILFFIILSSFVQTFKNNSYLQIDKYYSTITSVVVILILTSKVSTSLSVAISTVGVASNFIYSLLPTFFIILTASGGIATSASTNTLLLLLSQALTFISSKVFLPLTNCFMCIGLCSSISDELRLDKIIHIFRSFITKFISVCSATFVSILSIKTAVGAKADALGLRSMRFAINSVVPVIGSAISEGLLSIQSYSSLIKTSVGVVGVIAIALIFLPSIIEISIWRIILSISVGISDIFGDNSVTSLLNVFKDTFLLVNVILILSMLTTVVSFGILIVARTG